MPRGIWRKPRKGGRLTLRSRPIRCAHYSEYPEGYARWPYRRKFRRGDKCPTKHPAYVIHATGSVLTVWDAELLGEGRWEGRWMTRCSLHGTRVWHRSRAKAVASAREATFCAKCRADAIRTAPCRLCGAPMRGCPMCQ